MFRTDAYFAGDCAAWLGRVTGRGTDHIDVEAFAGDLVGHVDPAHFADARQDLAGVVPVVDFIAVRGAVRDLGAVERAVSAYRLHGATGVPLCAWDEFTNYRPAGLTVEIEGYHDWRDWQAFVQLVAGIVAGELTGKKFSADVSDFDISAWAVELLNRRAKPVDLGDRRLWSRVTGELGVDEAWALLGDFARTSVARERLAARNEAVAGADVVGVGRLEDRTHAASGRFDLSGSNFGGASSF